MIPFTQFLLPDGRRRDGGFARSADVEELARRLMEVGMRFEAEILRTGDVSLTVEGGDEDEGPIAIQVVPNGPAVPEAVDALVREAAATLGFIAP